VLDKVKERKRQWIEAVNSRNLDAYAELVADDVVWIPPVGAAITGRQEFRQWLRPFFGSYRYQYTSSNARVLDAGDWVVESADFKTQMTPVDGGPAMTHEGAYLVIWRRDSDGAWRIERYVDQSALQRHDWRRTASEKPHQPRDDGTESTG